MTPQVPALAGMTPMGFSNAPKASSTGGTITYTKTGLIHTAGRNYNSAHAPEEVRGVVKQGRKVKEEDFDDWN